MVRGAAGAEEVAARSSYEDTGPLFADGNGVTSAFFSNSTSGAASGTEYTTVHRSLSSRRRKAIVPTGGGPHGSCGQSPVAAANHDLQGMLYEKEKEWGKGRAGGGGGGILSGILNCLCRPKEPSTGSVSFDGRAVTEVTATAAAALLQQSRIQQEVLMETEETRDMWEWQMEQQQALTSQEHDLLERRSLDYGGVRGALLLSPFDLGRSSSARRSSSASASLLGDLSRTGSSTREGPGAGLLLASGVDASGFGHVRATSGPAGEGLGMGFLGGISALGHVISGSTSSARGGSGKGSSRDYRELPIPDTAPLSRRFDDPDVVAATVLLFETTLLRCRTEINAFCRVYMQQMVLSGYTLVKTLMDIEPNTVFLRKVHASYALEARIYSVMFRCFENDSFDDTGVTQILDQNARAGARLQDYFRVKGLDPEEALGAGGPAYDVAFHQFCANKSEEVAGMFGWGMAYRSASERDRFMEAFLRAAKWVWLLHRLAHATLPPMQILRVGRGMDLHPTYIESVAAPLPPKSSCPHCPSPKVEFMIMPGFIAPKTVFKSKVYQHYMCKPTPSSSSTPT